MPQRGEQTLGIVEKMSPALQGPPSFAISS